MSIFKGLVQINHVWPGIFGGAIFTARPINSKKIIICRASYKVLKSSPQKGDFWKVKGYVTFNKERHLNQISVSECYMQGLPNNQFLSIYLKKSPRFRGIGLGPKKIEKLINTIGDEGSLIDLMNKGKWKCIT